MTSVMMSAAGAYAQQSASGQDNWRDSFADEFKNPLVDAADMGMDTMVKRALDATDLDINAQEINGTTALMEAAYSGNVSTVELLLQYGADVNIQDDNGDTALSLAIRQGQQSIITLLKNAMDGAAIAKVTTAAPAVHATEMQEDELAELEAVVSGIPDVPQKMPKADKVAEVEKPVSGAVNADVPVAVVEAPTESVELAQNDVPKVGVSEVKMSKTVSAVAPDLNKATPRKRGSDRLQRFKALAGSIPAPRRRDTTPVAAPSDVALKDMVRRPINQAAVTPVEKMPTQRMPVNAPRVNVPNEMTPIEEVAVKATPLRRDFQTQSAIGEEERARARKEATEYQSKKGGLGVWGTVGIGAAVIGGGALALSGGGGGGGDGSSSSGGSSSGGSSSGGSSSGSSSSSSSSSSSGGSSSGSAFDTQEYKNQPSLAHVNAAVAYDRGYTGSGVKVAVIDNGVKSDHSELQGKVDASSFNFVTNSNDIAPLGAGGGVSSGTHAASVIAGKKDDVEVHGVAFDATILSLTAASGESFSVNARNSSLNYAVSNSTRIVNQGYVGTQSVSDVSGQAQAILQLGVGAVTAYNNAAVKQVANVWAAGDTGSAEPTLEAGLPVHIPGLANHWVAVAAVDNNNVILDTSNRCGSAADWCLVAPGVDVNGAAAAGDAADVDANGYVAFSGTQAAAPQVSGALAVLMSAFPSLTTEAALDILFSTATDLGAAGTDTVYGRGLVNLDAATAPVGTTTIPTGSSTVGQGASLAASSLKTGTAFGDAIANAGGKVTFFDAYQRAYETDLSNLVSPQSKASNSHKMLLNFARDYMEQKVALSDTVRMELSQVVTEEKRSTAGDTDIDSKRMSLISQQKNREFAAHYNMPMEDVFRYSAAQGYNGDMTMGKAVLANPYLSFAGDGMSIASRHRVNDQFSYRMGAFHGSPEDDKYGEYDAMTTGVVGELSYAPTEAVNTSLQFGVMSERDSFLGSETGGAFDMSRNNKTWFYGVAGSYRMTDRVQLFGSIAGGMSSASGTSSSLIQDMDQVMSESFSVGATYKSAMTERDVFGVALSQPLRVASGDASLLLPNGTTGLGDVAYMNRDVALDPSGREIDVEAFYRLPVGVETNVSTGAIYRHEPGHVKNAEAEQLLMMKLDHRF